MITQTIGCALGGIGFSFAASNRLRRVATGRQDLAVDAAFMAKVLNGMSSRIAPTRRSHVPLRAVLSVTPPEPLVPVESFAGTCFETMTFSFYGERHECGPDIDWRANPGSWHWGHDLNRFGFLVVYGAASSLQVHVAEGERQPFRGWFAPGLNRMTPGPMLILKCRRRLPVTLHTTLRSIRAQPA